MIIFPLQQSGKQITHTLHIKNWGWYDFFLPGGMKSNIIIIYPQIYFYKSCHCQYISPSVTGHFHVFIVKDLRVVVRERVAWGFLISLPQHFFISLFLEQLDKHQGRNIIYEYSFCQAKRFQYYKKDQLTRVRLAEKYDAFFQLLFFALWTSPSTNIERGEKNIFRGGQQVEPKGSFILALASTILAKATSLLMWLSPMWSRTEECMSLFWRMFLLTENESSRGNKLNIMFLNRI